MSSILDELKLPFHPSHVTWKPQATSKDKTKAMACAYGDVRAYQNRLDEVCGMDWSVTYTPWGDRIVCHVTISGVTRSSIGESDNQSEKSEIGGTAAEAQAFKRACAMFGLGRYLYALPSVWVEYDDAKRSFTDQAKAKLEGIIVAHYRRTMKEAEDSKLVKVADNAPPLSPDGDGGQHVGQKPPLASEAQRKRFHAIGTKIYGSDGWDDARHKMIGEITGGKTTSANDLYPAECDKLIVLMEFNQLGNQLYGDNWYKVSHDNAERISGKPCDDIDLTTEQLQRLIDGMEKLQRKRAQAPAPAKLAV